MGYGRREEYDTLHPSSTGSRPPSEGAAIRCSCRDSASYPNAPPNAMKTQASVNGSVVVSQDIQIDMELNPLLGDARPFAAPPSRIGASKCVIHLVSAGRCFIARRRPARASSALGILRQRYARREVDTRV